MAESDTTTQPNDAAASAGNSGGGHPQGEQLDRGTYEVIRNRLREHGAELRDKVDKLNEQRKSVFGSIEFTLTNTDRLTTSHNCIPRDMVAIGRDVLVGYNVHFGLKNEIDLTDVFAAYTFSDGKFVEHPLDLLNDEQFLKDFKDLYRYYKQTKFVKFFVKGPFLYMKFRVGKDVNDFKAFKWAFEGTGDDRTIRYLDGRSDHEVRYPDQHDFKWQRAGRDEQRPGKHPHVAIDDRLFVETTGGDLTIKVEDNTATGQGIYTEPVEDPDQTLDDAQYEYVVDGHLILLRIRPYQEHTHRYFIYNDKLQEVHRCDAIGHACVLLPDDHGLIFASGYYLSSGQLQTFASVPPSMLFEKRVAAPNGEDFLYVFYNRETGVYALMAYNLIAQTIETPIICHGYSFFDDGTLAYFKAQDEPVKHHAVQVWQTPIVGPNFVPPTQSDSRLFKIGNRDIVRGMAECVEVLGLIDRDDPYAELYLDIVKTTSDLLDSYYWLSDPECFGLNQTLGKVREAAQAAVGEFDKVTRIRKSTRQQTQSVAQEAKDLVHRNAARIYDNINIYVEALGALRTVRGKIISLRELRYADLALIDELEQEVSEQTDALSQKTVDYLLQDAALAPYEAAAGEHEAEIEQVGKVTEAKDLEEKILNTSGELELLIDIVSNLKIDDATQRTAIIDNISAIFAELNASRTKLRNRIQALGRTEGVAEFNSQLKLLNQSVVNYLDLCDTPEKTEQYLTKVMVQLEELEGRFAEFDEFVLQLAEKRDEVYNAFENRKLQLVEKRNKRANALAQAADRILGGIKSRVESMEQIEQINGYFASDLMIDKVRDIVDELTDLDDTVKVDDIQSRLKTVREDAVRQLKDRQELQEGGNVIRFGRHKFSINSQAIDLTTILRDQAMYLHLSGTRFSEKITDETFNATRPVWSQEVVSENNTVYRAEYLAYLIYKQSSEPVAGQPVSPGTAENDSRVVIPPITELANLEDDALLKLVQRYMGPRYSEGYTKGVHDVDAAKVLRALVDIGSNIGLLRYPSAARAAASVFWQTYADTSARALLQAQLAGFGAIRRLFPGVAKQRLYIDRATVMLQEFVEQYPVFDAALVRDAGEYLFHQLTEDAKGFVISPEAAALREAFEASLKGSASVRPFEDSLNKLADHPVERFTLIRDWLTAFLEGDEAEQTGELNEYIDEAAALIFEGRADLGRVRDVSVRRSLEALVGSHPLLREGKLTLHFNGFTSRLGRFAAEDVPRFQTYTQLKRDFVEQARDEMRLEEFEPKVLTSFVRNKLIDSVFLPLIGDNLAKQIGVTGEGKRTDRMGLLLLISPPGYGKTTLMEYIANRLGIIFMKINGPAIGHGVTSLDPTEAPNASAREEVEKLNLAFEMGDNVLIYLDDIQHTNPELLQKFISLCDAQRRIEGVYKGRTRTYDLRGRKVAVVMAGNPYTESGEKFRLPDMLTNRADTYNLGDIIGEHGEAFKLSYLENCLTSNPTLNPLASRSQADVYAIVKIATSGSREGVELQGNYAAQEVEEMVTVMRKLMTLRDVILTVNQQYIRSAGQEDQYRTEPPFLLQGSYRNMNRIAEKVVPVMNDEELMELIIATYEQDAQTLTTGAEANLLKFKEMIGVITPDEQARWEAICATFRRNNAVAAMGGDTTAAVVSQLAAFNDGLGGIKSAIDESAAQAAASSRAGGDEDRDTLDTSALAERLAPVLDHVAGLGDRLDGIRAALDSGAAELAKSNATMAQAASAKPARPGTVTAKFDKKTLDAFKALTEKLDHLTDGALNPVPPAGPPESPARTFTGKPAATEPSDVSSGAMPQSALPHEIKVINKIPATFLYVMKEQFNLMKGWLEPLTRITADQDDQLKELHVKIESVLMKYDTMIDRLEKARPTDDSDAEVGDE
ncbi:MAG: DNA repair ATPase [Planctomycetota bacterium]